MKKYIPIILCVTLFEVIIIPIGIQLEKYESWIDGFWDLRNFMLTSLMIATVIGIIDSESKRHKVLLKQYETYERFKYNSEQFVCSLCEVANFQSDMNIFLSEKNFDMFYQKLIEYMEQDLPKIQQKVISNIFLNYSTKELSRELAIKMYFEQYSRALNNVNYALLTNEFIGPIEHAIEQIDSIHNELQMERLLIEEQKSCYTDIIIQYFEIYKKAINKDNLYKALLGRNAQDFAEQITDLLRKTTNTSVLPGEIDGSTLLGKDLTLPENAEGPQILIYHTHSQETFADSRPGERADTVIGLGDDLQELLEKQYGYEVLHITEAFDMKEGCLERSRAYNYAEPVIAAALEEHPSIQVVIDLHRDGVNGSKRLVTEINGKPTAQIMFFNGLSRTKESGELTSLPNPYQAENLAFSFQMEYEAKQYYPGFSRCIYLKGYRYNLHLRPRSVLLEVGAQTNTVEEVKNAMGPFADILHKVLSGKSPASGG